MLMLKSSEPYFENHWYRTCMFVCAKSLQVCLTLCDPMDSSPPASSVHGDSPGENTGVGCHCLLQGIFWTQGLNLCLLWLLHCRWILYRWAKGEACGVEYNTGTILFFNVDKSCNPPWKCGHWAGSICMITQLQNGKSKNGLKYRKERIKQSLLCTMWIHRNQ